MMVVLMMMAMVMQGEREVKELLPVTLRIVGILEIQDADPLVHPERLRV